MSAPPPSGGQPAPERFAVEVGRRVVGIAVRAAGGFRFFSSDPDYAGLDSQTFPRVRALMHRIRSIALALAEKSRRSGRSPGPFSRLRERS